MTQAFGPHRLRELTRLDLFFKEHLTEWDGFCEAYLTPPTKSEPYTGDEYSNYKLISRIMGSAGKIYRRSNDYTDLELLLDLSFNCKTFKEFLRKHLDPRDDLDKPPFGNSYATLDVYNKVVAQGSPLKAIGEKPSSLWRERDDYRQLLSRLESACTSLTHFVVYQEPCVRQQRVPMLRDIETALVEKWTDFRIEELTRHPFMEGRPLSDAANRGLGNGCQQLMRAELLNTTQGHFAYSLLSQLFSSKCRTVIHSRIEDMRHKCFAETQLKPDAKEAVDYLFRAYCELFEATLFTYDPDYGATNDKAWEKQQASFATLLTDNLKMGMVQKAAMAYRMDHGFSARGNSERNVLQQRTESLDKIISNKKRDSDTPLGDFLSRPEVASDSALAKQVMDIVETMDVRHQLIIRRRFGIDAEIGTLQNIGQDLGVSKERVRQLETQAIGKLQEAMEGGDITDKGRGRQRN